MHTRNKTVITATTTKNTHEIIKRSNNNVNYVVITCILFICEHRKKAVKFVARGLRCDLDVGRAFDWNFRTRKNNKCCRAFFFFV